MPPFVIEIWDTDTIGDDFMCRAVIPVKDCAYSEDDKITEPRWHPLRLKSGAPACGEILISFSIVRDDFNFKTPLNYVDLNKFVAQSEYVVEINILGLRDLQSVGILPVKKAFISFNLKSLVPPDSDLAIENLKTQPNAAGTDPTINTVIKFFMRLPDDPLYTPVLTCTVFDNIFKSFL